MKRIWLLVIGVLLLSLVGGAGVTLAIFTAQADGQTNQFVAGNVSLYGYRVGDTVDGPMFYITAGAGANEEGQDGENPTGLWAPGDSQIRAFQIENTGTLDAKLMSLSTTVSGSQLLAAALEVQVCDTYDCDQTIYYDGTLAAMAAAAQPFAPPVVLGASLIPFEGDLTTLYFKVTLPLSADDDLEDQSLTAAFEVYAEQVRNNP